jgi:hypothetical protein
MTRRCTQEDCENCDKVAVELWSSQGAPFNVEVEVPREEDKKIDTSLDREGNYLIQE